MINFAYCLFYNLQYCVDLAPNKGSLLPKVSVYPCISTMLLGYVGLLLDLFAKRFPFIGPQILSVTARTIQKDAEEKKVSFNPRPYFRLFINLLSELSTADLHDGATIQVYDMYIYLACTKYLHSWFAPCVFITMLCTRF